MPRQLPTAVPTPDATIQEPTPTATPAGVTGTIHNTSIGEGVVTATVKLSNRGETNWNGSIALRFVENDSHAMVGKERLDPGQTKTLVVPLRTYGDDPEALTVQLRIDGTVVAERVT